MAVHRRGAGASRIRRTPGRSGGHRGRAAARAKTDRTDTRQLRQQLAEGRLPESWIPPMVVREMRAKLECYHDLREEHTAWVQRIHATLFHHGVPVIEHALSTAVGRARLEAGEGLSAAARQTVGIALRVADALQSELDALYKELARFACRLLRVADLGDGCVVDSAAGLV